MDANALAKQAIMQYAGMPNLNQILNQYMNANPQFKELASMIKS